VAPGLAWRQSPWLLGWGSVVLFGAALEGLIRAGAINQFVVPFPSDVLGAIGRIVAEEDLPHRFLLTAAETLAAGTLVTTIGVAVGTLLYRSARLSAAFEGWVASLAAAPLVLAYPLFLVLIGRSAVTIAAIGFAAGLAPVILKTLEGLTATRRVLVDVGRSFRLTPRQQFRKILFPAAVPTIFVGLRLGLIFCLINIVGVEFLINFGGLGQLINEMAERYDLAGTYAAILFVILVSVLFFFALERVERWLTPSA
jgi:NitT/TauT family transport system permease protein